MKKMKTILMCTISLFIMNSGIAQNTLLSGFKSLPQSSRINPAQNLNLKFHIGIPAISGTQINFQNTGFNALDLFEKDTDINDNVDRVINSLGSDDYLTFNNTIDLLDIGVNSKIGYFTFGTSLVNNFYLDYPTQLLKLTRFNGENYIGENLDISDVHAEFSSYLATHIGFQKNILDDQLNLGIRYKFLSGIAHGFVDHLNMGVERIDDFNLNLKANSLIKTSGFNDLSDGNMPSGNYGHAIDLGAFYSLNDKVTLGASIIDLGFINWDNDRIDFKSDGEYNYSGLQVNLSDNDPFNDGFDRIIDDLEEGINYRSDTLKNSAYSRSLHTQINLSGNYQLNKKISFGGLYNLKKVDVEWMHNLSLSSYIHVGNAFQVMANMNVNKSQPKFGLGLSTSAGPLQLYILNDNLINSFNYGRLKSVNISFGVNFTMKNRQNVDPENTDSNNKKKRAITVVNGKEDKEALKEKKQTKKKAEKKEAEEKKNSKKEAKKKSKEEKKKKESETEEKEVTPSLPTLTPNNSIKK